MTSQGLDGAEAAIWVGSYTDDFGREGIGIGVLSLDADGVADRLGTAAEVPSPSFIAVHPTLPVVYAVGEHAGTVAAYRRSGPCSLVALGTSWPAGESACHVAVDPAGRFIVVACWGDGRVVLFTLDGDGAIVSRQEAQAATDHHTGAAPPGEKRVSRAHASLMLPDGSIMTTDLGFDLVRVWSYVEGRGLMLDHEVVLPLGCGPRHLVRHPSGSILVVTEYSVEVVVLATQGPPMRATDHGGRHGGRHGGNPPRFSVASIAPATLGGKCAGDFAAEIALSADGNHAYVGVRGSNRISTLRIADDGLSIRPVGDLEGVGNWPRHHLVSGDRLYVAAEHDNEVKTFELDVQTGLPGAMIGRVRVAAPTVLVGQSGLAMRIETVERFRQGVTAPIIGTVTV